MRDVIRLGMLVCGTVGTGVLRVLAEHTANVEARRGAGMLPAAASVVRDIIKDARVVRGGAEAVDVTMITHAARAGDVDDALTAINAAALVLGPTRRPAIEEAL